MLQQINSALIPVSTLLGNEGYAKIGYMCSTIFPW